MNRLPSQHGHFEHAIKTNMTKSEKMAEHIITLYNFCQLQVKKSMQIILAHTLY